MTIAEWIVTSMVKLHDASVPNGRTDCLVLLADLFDTDKSWVHTNPEHELDPLQLRELDYKLNKRIAHTPLAYIRGFNEFYGRKFMVNSQVLIPRSESESFIDIFKTLPIEMPRVADIGTGSGCIGITAALEIPESVVHLYDIDADALGVAYHNARQYDLELQYYQSDLLANMQRGQYDVLFANLPYVPQNLVTSPEIEQEPAKALFSGLDGLNHYRRFWKEIRSLEFLPKYVLVESLDKQHGSVTTLAKNAGYRLKQTDILVQLFVR